MRKQIAFISFILAICILVSGCFPVVGITDFIQSEYDEDYISTIDRVLSSDSSEKTIIVRNRNDFINAIYDITRNRCTSAKICYDGNDYAEVIDGESEEQFNAIFNEVFFIKDDVESSDDCDYLWGNIAHYYLELTHSKDGKAYYKVEIEYYESAEEMQAVNQEVALAISKLNLEGMNEYEKVKTIHDYVVETICYDDAINCSYSAYGGLINGETVCNGYALLFYKMCTEAGISCKFVSGPAGNISDDNETVLHAWNIVEIDHIWYYVDTTWDDDDSHETPGKVYYDYFLVGETTMQQDHSLEWPYNTRDFRKKYPISKNNYPEVDKLDKYYE